MATKIILITYACIIGPIIWLLIGFWCARFISRKQIDGLHVALVLIFIILGPISLGIAFIESGIGSKKIKL